MDLLSNMLSKIKNSAMAGRPEVEVPFSKKCLEVAEVIKGAGFLSAVKTFKNEGKSFKGIHLNLSDANGKILISDVKIMSKPGRRLYISNSDIKAQSNFVVSVVSTSRGMLKGSEAKKRKLGGELICIVR